jgi:hypothetical protein
LLGVNRPSGKTTYKKLGLAAKKGEPTLFFVANGAKPRQLSNKHVKSAQSIVTFVTKNAEPVMRRPTSADDLQAHCLGRKWCALVLTDGRLAEPHKSDAAALMREHRSVQFNAVDASKYRLSTEPKVLVGLSLFLFSLSLSLSSLSLFSLLFCLSLLSLPVPATHCFIPGTFLIDRWANHSGKASRRR